MKYLLLVLLTITLNANQTPIGNEGDVCEVGEYKILYKYGASRFNVICLEGYKWVRKGEAFEQMMDSRGYNGGASPAKCKCPEPPRKSKKAPRAK